MKLVLAASLVLNVGLAIVLAVSLSDTPPPRDVSSPTIAKVPIHPAPDDQTRSTDSGDSGVQEYQYTGY